jgi:hypothetical protein
MVSVCEHCGRGEEVFSQNITHNMTPMADAAGVYRAVWRPEDLGYTHAGQLVPLLRGGIAAMESKPDHFKQFNPVNGWGSYDVFLPWLQRYLAACLEHPEAKVEASR